MGLFGGSLGSILGGAVGSAIGKKIAGKEGAAIGGQLGTLGGGAAGAAIPIFKKGGRVKKTGLARVHKGEYILPKGVAPTKAQKAKVAKKQASGKKKSKK